MALLLRLILSLQDFEYITDCHSERKQNEGVSIGGPGRGQARAPTLYEQCLTEQVNRHRVGARACPRPGSSRNIMSNPLLLRSQKHLQEVERGVPVHPAQFWFKLIEVFVPEKRPVKAAQAVGNLKRAPQAFYLLVARPGGKVGLAQAFERYLVVLQHVPGDTQCDKQRAEWMGQAAFRQVNKDVTLAIEEDVAGMQVVVMQRLRYVVARQFVTHLLKMGSEGQHLFILTARQSSRFVYMQQMRCRQRLLIKLRQQT